MPRVGERVFVARLLRRASGPIADAAYGKFGVVIRNRGQGSFVICCDDGTKLPVEASRLDFGSRLSVPKFSLKGGTKSESGNLPSVERNPHRAKPRD